ncbi:hypothetical protein ABZV77_24675 [Streptomyces sp. NPDC004732]|uniref:hypothetical protein n=1 Tax=Streptomyces sp. NPDC004732 TaxID=3154290 RepID=UPI0033A357DC
MTRAWLVELSPLRQGALQAHAIAETLPLADRTTREPTTRGRARRTRWSCGAALRPDQQVELRTLAKAWFSTLT